MCGDDGRSALSLDVYKRQMQDLGITDESHFESTAERASDGLDECQVPLDKDKIVEIYRKCMK